MSKQSIINHFSQHGLVHELPKEALAILFSPYAAVFEARGLTLDFELDDDLYQAHLTAIKNVLLNIYMDTEEGRDLSNKLDAIVLIDKNFTQVSSFIEDVLFKWRDGLESTGLNLDEQLQLIVALCIDEREEVQNAMALIESRIHSMDTSTNRDYHWLGNFTEKQLDGASKPLIFKVASDEKLAENVGDLEEKLDNGFAKHRYTTKCRVVLQPKSEDGEIWALVEHSGRIVVKETMKDGKTGTVKYPPLTRSIVVLDTERKMLRIKSGSEWMYNLLLKTFSAFFCDDEDIFQPRQTYHFAPIYNHGFAKAFALDEFRHQIKSVTIVNIKLDVFQGFDDDVIMLYNKKSRDVRTAWEKLSDLHSLDIRAITLRLRIKGCPNPVTVKIDLEKGLFVSRPAHTALVRNWLRRRGFELYYPVREFSSVITDTQNNEYFWPLVLEMIKAGETSKSQVYKLESRAPGIGDFVWRFVDLDESTRRHVPKWTDPYGKEWSVEYNHAKGSYYGSDVNVELGVAKGPEIDPSEVELLPIDTNELLKTIQIALLKNSKLKLEDKRGGIYRLGEMNALGVTVFLATGTNWQTAFLKKNTTNASIAVLTFTKNPPDQYAEQVKEDELQHAWLGDLLYWDVATHRFADKIAIDTYLHDNKTLMFQDNETPPWHRWPCQLPESCHLSEVEIILGCDYVTIRYGEIEKRFSLDELIMLRPKRPKKKPNDVTLHPNYKCLLRLIQLNEKYGDKGFTLDEAGSSGTRDNLNKAIGLFFRTNDCVWCETPENPGRYRLAFAKCKTTVVEE